jgi:hypothetical protein
MGQTQEVFRVGSMILARSKRIDSGLSQLLLDVLMRHRTRSAVPSVDK